MIKKLVSILLSSCFIQSSVAFADDSCLSQSQETPKLLQIEQDKSNIITQSYYMRIGGGPYKINSFKKEDTKFHAVRSSLYSVAFGAYIRDQLRVDISFENFVKSKINGTYRNTAVLGTAVIETTMKTRMVNGVPSLYKYEERVVGPDQRNYPNTTVFRTAVIETTIQALMINGFANLYKDDRFEYFVGAGIGVSNIKEKISAKSQDLTPRVLDAPLINTSSISKTKNSLTYQISAGVDFKLTNNLKAEVSCRWMNFGHTKPKHILSSVPYSTTKTHYTAYAMLLGLRYSF